VISFELSMPPRIAALFAAYHSAGRLMVGHENRSLSVWQAFEPANVFSVMTVGILRKRGSRRD